MYVPSFNIRTRLSMCIFVCVCVSVVGGGRVCVCVIWFISYNELWPSTAYSFMSRSCLIRPLPSKLTT